LLRADSALARVCSAAATAFSADNTSVIAAWQLVGGVGLVVGCVVPGLVKTASRADAVGVGLGEELGVADELDAGDELGVLEGRGVVGGFGVLEGLTTAEGCGVEEEVGEGVGDAGGLLAGGVGVAEHSVVSSVSRGWIVASLASRSFWAARTAACSLVIVLEVEPLPLPPLPLPPEPVPPVPEPPEPEPPVPLPPVPLLPLPPLPPVLLMALVVVADVFSLAWSVARWTVA
jgi:hypothetical protein